MYQHWICPHSQKSHSQISLATVAMDAISHSNQLQMATKLCLNGEQNIRDCINIKTKCYNRVNFLSNGCYGNISSATADMDAISDSNHLEMITKLCLHGE